MNRLLPSLFAILAVLYLAGGAAAGNALIIVEGALLLLLVLPALCTQIYELTPAYKRKHAKQMEEFEAALKCVDDLAELGGNKTDENVARFKSKWPDFVQRITSSEIACMVAYEKGVWKLFCEISRGEA